MPTVTVNGAELYHERIAASADTLFGIELGTDEWYLPDDETLAAIAAPVRLLVSNDSLPFFAEMTHRLGNRLDVDVAVTPGTHAPYLDHPRELAEAVRPLLWELSAINT
jgi:pimeloyl-ACP methyl ester carboxylesterase